MFLTVLADRFGGAQLWNYIGYIASVIVFLSFVMTSVVKLRWVSTIGSALFSLYGFMIGSIPTGVLNAGVVAANLYYLIRMKKNEDLFTAHTIRIENDFLKDFIMYNGRDIQKYSSGYTYGSTDANIAILVYCNMTAAGLLIGKDEGEGVLRIDLDYATAEYRDCRVGKFLYRKLEKMGFRKLITTTDNAHHIRYLNSMGFTEKDGQYIKTL